MNRSSIVLAFLIAGFISVAIHDFFLGPVEYGPNNTLHQMAKEYTSGTAKTPLKKD